MFFFFLLCQWSATYGSLWNKKNDIKQPTRLKQPTPHLSSVWQEKATPKKVTPMQRMHRAEECAVHTACVHIPIIHVLVIREQLHKTSRLHARRHTCIGGPCHRGEGRGWACQTVSLFTGTAKILTHLMMNAKLHFVEDTEDHRYTVHLGDLTTLNLHDECSFTKRRKKAGGQLACLRTDMVGNALMCLPSH